jgi:hypothetical protein
MKIVYKKNTHPITTKRIAKTLYQNKAGSVFVNEYGISASAKPIINKDNELVGFIFKNVGT